MVDFSITGLRDMQVTFRMIVFSGFTGSSHREWVLDMSSSSSAPWMSFGGGESSTGHPQVYFYMEFAILSSRVPGSVRD